jgi:hypothetical protein
MMAAVAMAVAAVAVVRKTAVALALGVTAATLASGRRNLPREGWSSTCRGGSVRHCAVNELMEEGAGEGEEGDCSCRCGFDSGGCRPPSPLLTCKPDIDNDSNKDDDNDDKGLFLRGGEG